MPKLKAKKETRGKSGISSFPWFVWLAIGLGIIGVVAFVRIHPTNQPSSDNLAESKAAIIDQLYSLQPNEAFISEVTKELEDYGFEVDIYQGDEVIVDLYRQLPGLGYKVIIFRAHSGLLSHREDSEVVVTKATSLFTNEPYSEREHVKEQLNGELARARVTEGYPIVFAIGSRFIKHSMEGEFKNTVVIMMGCHCLYLTDLAQAFVDTGASSYLAWDGLVGLDYVDHATISLMQKICSEELSIEAAVAKTMAQEGPDPNYGAVLKYYPPDSGSRTIAELTK